VAGLLALYHSMPGYPAILYAVGTAYLVFAAALTVRAPARGACSACWRCSWMRSIFLVLAGFAAETSTVAGLLFFLYLLTEALVFYGPVEVVVVAAVG